MEDFVLPKTRIPILFGAFVALLISCNRAGASKQDGTYPALPTVSREVAGLRYPVEEANLSVNQQYAVYYAEDILMERCMKKGGEEWVPIRPPVQFVSADRRRYGVMELDVVRRFGYHMPPPPPEATARIVRLNHLTPKADEIAFGADGQGGCYAVARERILGGAHDVDYKLFNDLNRKSLSLAQKTQPVKRAIGRWSACMKASGYRYEDPFEAVGASSWGREKRPSSKEIEVATTDVECKSKSHLVAVWAREEVRLQTTYIQENGPYFRKLLAAKDSQMRTVRKITGISVMR
ncbi:hypothetical protein ACIRVK_03195 [Streptomyces sp. NPDC101152]|uniref:hypothetical protein n=1 Tax=Streptomyces sp. NPDC101152 TaxID=3366116 RepID=UPI003825F388